MGVTDQHKTFCKVTVHRSEPRTQHKPWQNARSTIAYKQLTPPPPTKDELARWTATGAAAIDGMPSRRRAATTTTAMEAMANFSTRDPLSRMTMRYEQDQTSTTPSPTMDVSELDTANDRSDSFLFVDTDHADPVRQTFDEDTKMFVPATPPIPSGISIDMLPTVDFTPKLAPSHFTTTANDLEKAFAIPEPEYEDNDWKAESRIRFSTPQSTPRESRIRISTPGQENALSSLFGSHADYVDELPTPLLSSSMGTPLDDHKPLSAGASVSEPEPEPIAAPESLVDEPAMAASYEEIPLSTTPQPMVESEVVDEDEEEDDAQQAFVEVDSEGEDDVEMDDNEDFDVCENFDAILGEPLPNRGSRWRFSINPKKSFSSSGINLNASRQKRGMSSPPRMVGMPPQPNLARHMSVPAAFTPPHNARPKPIVHAPVGEPLYHGQMLHLQFKSSAGNTVQVSAHQRRSKSSVFSKLIECFSVDSEPFADGEDALRIIAHTTDGHIRGGDRISLARGDGSVLRIQKMSKKLGFSPKIDMKAKFVVCGVPEGTVVTDTNKFYLQSVYDRTKTVGFLKDRRHPGAGCLVMYAYRTTDDKSEPIQFFKRPTPPSFAAMHTAQQGHNLPLSPVSGALM